MSSRRRLPEPVAMRNTSGAVGALLGRAVEETEFVTGTQRAPLNKIHRGRFKRLYYDPEAIAAFGNKLKQEGGVHTAVWVRPLLDGPEDEFELIAGNYRWLGSESAGFPDLPVLVFQDVDDRTALKLSRLENDQRSDFNRADELFLFLEELSLELVLSTEEVVKILYRLGNEAKGKTTQQLLGSQTEAAIDAYFASTKITRASFVAKWLPILKWPTDVLQALHEGRLSYEKLAIIRGVKDPEQRQALIDMAVEECVSLDDLRARVEQLRSGTQRSDGTPTLKDTVSGVLKQLKAAKLETINTKDKKVISQSLSQMADILEKYQ